MNMETILFATRLIGSLFFGAITGVALSHLMQKQVKASFTSAQYLLLQQKLYLVYGPVMGMIELTASLVVLMTTLLLPFGTLPSMLSLVAYMGTVALFLIWAIGLDPVSLAPFAGWIRWRARRTGAANATGVCR